MKRFWVRNFGIRGSARGFVFCSAILVLGIFLGTMPHLQSLVAAPMEGHSREGENFPPLPATALDLSSGSLRKVQATFDQELKFFRDSRNKRDLRGMRKSAQKIFALFYSQGLMDPMLPKRDRKQIFELMIGGDSESGQGGLLALIRETDDEKAIEILLDEAWAAYEGHKQFFDNEALTDSIARSMALSAFVIPFLYGGYRLSKYWKSRRHRPSPIVSGATDPLSDDASAAATPTCQFAVESLVSPSAPRDAAASSKWRKRMDEFKNVLSVAKSLGLGVLTSLAVYIDSSLVGGGLLGTVWYFGRIRSTSPTQVAGHHLQEMVDLVATMQGLARYPRTEDASIESETGFDAWFNQVVFDERSPRDAFDLWFGQEALLTP